MKKLMIASDLHGDRECVEQLLRRYEKSRADRLVLLGDLLYHGPRNDLPEGYDPKGAIKLLNAVKNDLLCVRGNCDTEVDGMVLDFPIMADYAYIAIDDVSFFATHGHKYNLDALPPLKRGEILLHGHTHISAAEPFGDGNLYINPGSVSIPKNGTPRGYIEYIDGIIRFFTLEGEEFKRIQL